MEAKELMINDIVGTRFHAQPMRYSGIFTNYEPLNEKPYTRLRLMFSENEGLDVPECDIIPIPLTKEVLKANGFILKGKTSEYDHDSYYKYYVDKDDNAYELNFTPTNGCIELFGKNRIYGIKYIKYVHELQHALRLCGLIELADNFKIA